MNVKMNMDIRNELKRNSVYQWQLADKLHIGEITLVRWLRHELAPDKRQMLLDAICQIVKERSA